MTIAKGDQMHPFNEAGRHLKAAIMSYRLARAGVDSTLKEIPDDPGPEWCELAEDLLRKIAEQFNLRLQESLKGRADDMKS